MIQNKITKLLSILCLGVGVASITSCSKESLIIMDTPEEELLVTHQEEVTNANNIIEGVVRVKLSRDLAESLYEQDLRSYGSSLRSVGEADLEDFLDKIETKELTRIFPNTGKYDQRKRREGLHQWYDISFETKEYTAAAVASMISEFEAVDYAATVSIIDAPKNDVIPFTPDGAMVRANNNGFDDPLLGYQWHYDNQGKWKRHKAAADINLFKAWELETGKPNVVVAVVDGGIDFGHEDLKAQKYKEYPGYNFADRQETIVPIPHGTHVAGTVAATNNNGVGVGGVAGGDGTEGSGVKLMSCQVFSVTPSGVNTTARNFGEALVWAADHGAHIAQNSWGDRYPGRGKVDEATKTGIDYFIKYAGCDEEGNQLPDAPMKGGVVIFAAGNDGLDYQCFPAAYPPVVAVSSMSPNFLVTSYSNRGDWVDIMAPGGNVFLERGGVLSTVPGNQYGYMQGTSMACPHVSGIAALILSKHGGRGFTNTELQSRLENAVLKEDINSLNPQYSGRLGNGFIDAYVALLPNEKKAPESPSNVEVTPELTAIHLSFKAVKDEDNGTAALYQLYLSDQPVTKERIAMGLKPLLAHPAHYARVGDPIEMTASELDHSTKYYLAIVAVDIYGEVSEPTFIESGTLPNKAPELSVTIPTPIQLVEGQKSTFTVEVKDTKQQPWRFEVTGDLNGVYYERTDGGVLFRINGAPVGKHNITLSVTDYYFEVSTITIPYEVRANHAPEVVANGKTIYLPVSGDYSTQGVVLSDYLRDPDGDDLTYTIVHHDPSLVSAEIVGEQLKLQAIGDEGNTYVRLSAQDPYGKSVQLTLPIQLVKDQIIYMMYPVPVSSYLNLIVSPKLTTLEVSILSANGVLFKRERFTFDAKSPRHLQVEVKGLPVGSYILRAMDGEGGRYESSFVKL